MFLRIVRIDTTLDDIAVYRHSRLRIAMRRNTPIAVGAKQEAPVEQHVAHCLIFRIEQTTVFGDGTSSSATLSSALRVDAIAAPIRPVLQGPRHWPCLYRPASA
jgi:hypothetical protein